MPNKNEHIEAGFWIGLGVTLLSSISKQNEEIRNGYRIEYDWSTILLESIVGGSGCAIGECLPDSLEPAIHPNHRSVFHCVGSLGLSTSILSQNSLSNERLINIFLKGVSGGYTLHLIQDSQTPKSIPLLL